MRDYDRIYERVVHRGDEILEQRRIKAVKIKRTSYAVSGICAAVIAGTGIWRMTELRELPDERLSEVYISEEDTTDTSSVTSTKTTETLECKQLKHFDFNNADIESQVKDSNIVQ